MSGFPVPTRRGRPPGARSRDKGNRVERMIARLLTANGFAARKVSGMYRPGIRVRLLGVDRAVEVKCRGAGFRQPLGIVVFGGVIVSTLLTLVVIPCVYVLFDGFAQWVTDSISDMVNRRRAARSTFPTMDYDPESDRDVVLK